MFVQILPEEVRSKISAGEVIESPADCVKELIENAIDAKATRVQVEIIKGGKKYISVRDDGIGIHPEDMEKVFLDYATSKIKTIDDLNTLQTYGFRGEALSSICKVSRVIIRSRYFQEEKGIQIKLQGGKLESKESVGMPVGTKVEVFDLFYNLPARLKFLKSEETEKNRIVKLIREYAIANPHVAFVLQSNGREIINLPKNQEIRERLEELFNTPFEEFHAQVETAQIRLFISVENKRGEVHLFVNSRPVYNKNLSEHVRRSAGYKKIAVCIIDIPPYMVDFNVHPKKREVKIYKERKILNAISQILKTPSYTTAIKQEKAPYSVDPVIFGVLDNTIALVKIGDFLYFFDVHLLSERLNFERGMDESKSCRLAHKAGEDISKEELMELLKAWMSFDNPYVCPHGRPIYYRIYLGDVYKSLGRSI